MGSQKMLLEQALRFARMTGHEYDMAAPFMRAGTEESK